MLKKTGHGEVYEDPTPLNALVALLYNFDFDGSSLKSEHKSWLKNRIGPQMQSGEFSLWICGTASKVGADWYNKQLSKKRAESVANYLTGELKVPRKCLQTEWVGESEAVAAHDSNTDRAVVLRMQRTRPQDLPLPVPMPTPPPPPDNSRLESGSARWLGFGVKVGVHPFLGGYDQTLAYLWSADRPKTDGFWLDVWTARVGPGIGASGGLVMVFVSHIFDPHELRHFPLSGTDFQLSVGVKMGPILKMARHFPVLEQVAKQGKSAVSRLQNYALREGIMTGLKSNLLLWDQLFSDKPEVTVTVADIPLTGVGSEVSVYHGWGGCNPYDIRYTPPEDR